MRKFVPAVFGAASLVFAASASADHFGTFTSDYEVRTPSSANESSPSYSSHHSVGRYTGSAVAKMESDPTRSHQEQSFTGATGESVAIQEYRGGTAARVPFPSSVDESAPWRTR